MPAAATSAATVYSHTSYVETDRLRALLAENEEFARRGALYRTCQEEIDAASMRSPLTAMQAYGYLGLCLGAFPPAAFFIKMGGYGFKSYDHRAASFLIFLFMNAACAVVGWKMGKIFGDTAQKFERASWTKMIFGVSLLALGWACVTGFAGGAIVFIIGGIFGAFFAAPVAFTGFITFAALHRTLERGALIERKHVLPMAAGISLIIAAFILGLK
jgi:uncharacterized protein (DUF697 family)